MNSRYARARLMRAGAVIADLHPARDPAPRLAGWCSLVGSECSTLCITLGNIAEFLLPGFDQRVHRNGFEFVEMLSQRRAEYAGSGGMIGMRPAGWFAD